MVEVTVSGQQQQVMLQDQRGNPYIVNGDGRCLSAQLCSNRGEKVRGLLIREQQPNARRIQEPNKHPLILASPAALLKSRPQLSQNDEGEINPFCLLNLIGDFRYVTAKVTIGIRVEGDFHRHNDGSIRSNSRIAASNSGSSTQDPRRKFKSRCRIGSPCNRKPSVKASNAAAFRLLPSRLAFRRKAVSTAAGT